MEEKVVIVKENNEKKLTMIETFQYAKIDIYAYV